MSDRRISFPTTGNGAAFCEDCDTFADWDNCTHGPVTDAEFDASKPACECADGGWTTGTGGFCFRCCGWRKP